jgi:hypothetical protein
MFRLLCSFKLRSQSVRLKAVVRVVEVGGSRNGSSERTLDLKRLSFATYSVRQPVAWRRGNLSVPYRAPFFNVLINTGFLLCG